MGQDLANQEQAGCRRVAIGMFLFFSNGVGLAASIAISVIVTLVLVYACSGS
jgi:hypothetical protein